MKDTQVTYSEVDNALGGSQADLITSSKYLLTATGTATEAAPITIAKNTVIAKPASNVLIEFNSEGSIGNNVFYGILAEDVVLTNATPKPCTCFIGGQFDPLNLVWVNEAIDGTGSTCIDDARLKGIFLDKNNY